MGDADLETCVQHFLKHKSFEKFVKMLVQEGHGALLPPDLAQERRKALAKRALDKAQAEYAKACE